MSDPIYGIIAVLIIGAALLWLNVKNKPTADATVDNGEKAVRTRKNIDFLRSIERITGELEYVWILYHGEIYGVDTTELKYNSAFKADLIGSIYSKRFDLNSEVDKDFLTDVIILTYEEQEMVNRIDGLAATAQLTEDIAHLLKSFQKTTSLEDVRSIMWSEIADELVLRVEMDGETIYLPDAIFSDDLNWHSAIDSVSDQMKESRANLYGEDVLFFYGIEVLSAPALAALDLRLKEMVRQLKPYVRAMEDDGESQPSYNSTDRQQLQGEEPRAGL